MTLNEALNRLYSGTVVPGPSAEYYLLREAVRQLTPAQVREIEELTNAS